MSRIISLLLIPCLAADPAFAGAIESGPTDLPIIQSLAGVFQKEALVNRSAAAFAVMDPRGHLQTVRECPVERDTYQAWPGYSERFIEYLIAPWWEFRLRHILHPIRYQIRHADNFADGHIVWRHLIPRVIGQAGMYAAASSTIAWTLTHYQNAEAVILSLAFGALAYMLAHAVARAVFPWAPLTIRNPQGAFKDGRSWTSRKDQLDYWKEKTRIAYGGKLPDSLESLDATGTREEQFVWKVMRIDHELNQTLGSHRTLEKRFAALKINAQDVDAQLKQMTVRLRRLRAELRAEFLKFKIIQEQTLRTPANGMSVLQERFYDEVTRISQAAKAAQTLDRVGAIEEELERLNRRFRQLTQWLDRLNQIEGAGFLEEDHRARKMRETLLNLSSDQLGLGWKIQESVLALGMAKIERVINRRARGMQALRIHGARLEQVARRIIRQYPEPTDFQRMDLERQLQHLRFRIGNGAPRRNTWSGWEAPLARLEHTLGLMTSSVEPVAEPESAAITENSDAAPAADANPADTEWAAAFIQEMRGIGFPQLETAFETHVFGVIDDAPYRQIPAALATIEQHMELDETDLAGEKKWRVGTLWTKMARWSRLTPERQEEILNELSASLPPECMLEFRDLAWSWRRRVEMLREAVRWWTVLVYLEAVVAGVGEGGEFQKELLDEARSNVASVNARIEALGIPALGETDIDEESLSEARAIQTAFGRRGLSAWDLTPDTAPRDYASLADALRHGGPILVGTFENEVWTPLANVHDVEEATTLLEKLQKQDAEGGWPIYQWLTDLAQGLDGVRGDNDALYNRMVHEFDAVNGLGLKDLENLKMNTWALGTGWQRTELVLGTLIHHWTEEQTHAAGRYAALERLGSLAPSAKIRARIQEAPLEYTRTHMDRFGREGQFSSMAAVEADVDAGLPEIGVARDLTLPYHKVMVNAYRLSINNILVKQAPREWAAVCEKVRHVRSPLLRVALSETFETWGQTQIASTHSDLIGLSVARKVIREAAGRLAALGETAPDLAAVLAGLQENENTAARAALHTLFQADHPDFHVLSEKNIPRLWIPIFRAEAQSWFDRQFTLCRMDLRALQSLQSDVDQIHASEDMSREWSRQLQNKIEIAREPKQRKRDPVEVAASRDALAFMISALETLRTDPITTAFAAALSRLTQADVELIHSRVGSTRYTPEALLEMAARMEEDAREAAQKETSRGLVMTFQKRIYELKISIATFVAAWDHAAQTIPQLARRELNEAILYYRLWHRLESALLVELQTFNVRQRAEADREFSQTPHPLPSAFAPHLALLIEEMSTLAATFGDPTTILGSTLGRLFRDEINDLKILHADITHFIESHTAGPAFIFSPDDLESIIAVERMFHWFAEDKPDNTRIHRQIAAAVDTLMGDLGHRVGQKNAEHLIGADTMLIPARPGSASPAQVFAQKSTTLSGAASMEEALRQAVTSKNPIMEKRLPMDVSERILQAAHQEFVRIRDHAVTQRWFAEGASPALYDAKALCAVIDDVERLINEPEPMTHRSHLSILQGILFVMHATSRHFAEREKAALRGEHVGELINLEGGYLTLLKQSQLQLFNASASENLLKAPIIRGFSDPPRPTRSTASADWQTFFRQLHQDLLDAYQELTALAPGMVGTYGRMQMELLDDLLVLAPTFKPADIFDPYSPWYRFLSRLSGLCKFHNILFWYSGSANRAPMQEDRIEKIVLDIKIILEASGEAFNMKALRGDFGLDFSEPTGSHPSKVSTERQSA